MLRDHPLLTVLGRRGRAAVVDVLLQDPGPWSVRGLARAAGVLPATAARTVQELEGLGAVEALRPGREAQVRFLAGSPLGHALAALRLPDVRQEAVAAFARAFVPPAGVQAVSWQAPEDFAGDPACPTRIALLCDDDPAAAMDAAGTALDAVRAQGWPAPEITAWEEPTLERTDPMACAILDGRPIRGPP